MAKTPVMVRPVAVGDILDLRYRVLRAGLPRDAASFPDDDHPQTLHLAAYSEGKIVGCVTVMVNTFCGQRACQVRGMAVETDLQRGGIGGKLLAEADNAAKMSRVGLIWANVRKSATEFYRKHGWVVVSEEFEIPTAGPHFKMIKQL